MNQTRPQLCYCVIYGRGRPTIPSQYLLNTFFYLYRSIHVLYIILKLSKCYLILVFFHFLFFTGTFVSIYEGNITLCHVSILCLYKLGYFVLVFLINIGLFIPIGLKPFNSVMRYLISLLLFKKHL